MRRTLPIITAALVLVTAACGSDDESTDVTSSPATADTAAADTTAGASATTVADGQGGGDGTDAAFPVTIEHKYGETTIEAEPMRVVSVGFGEHDNLLAIGVVPVAVRDWYGEQPYATWPWAQDELGDATPEVLSSTELNFEQIAALEPDLILGIASGMTDSDYATLSAIAPTVAQPADYVDYGTPWDVSIEIAGRATGHVPEAEQVIADTNQMFADARDEHPEFAGATAAVTFFFEEQPGAYNSEDIRSRALTELGFEIPAEIDELAGDAFFVSISAEDLSVIDTDVVVWIGSGAEAFDAIRDLPTRPTMRAFAEGREVVADDLLSAAFSHAGPLSLEYVIDELVPELALAVDGDPATEVASAAMIAPLSDDATSSGGEADAASQAWRLVFDSSVGFDEKAPHIEDADALQATVEAYTAASAAMGGITLEPTEVVVDGDTANVTYDVMFGDTAAYTALSGVIALGHSTPTMPGTGFS